jgi:hypothetical protein
MPDDDKVVQLHSTTPEVSSEERARRLAVEVERLARLPVVEWMYYVATGDIAKKYDIESGRLKAMVEALIRANEKKVRGVKDDDRRERRQIERKQERDDRLARQEAQRARKEAERIEREQEARRKKREAALHSLHDLAKVADRGGGGLQLRRR